MTSIRTYTVRLIAKSMRLINGLQSRSDEIMALLSRRGRRPDGDTARFCLCRVVCLPATAAMNDPVTAANTCEVSAVLRRPLRAVCWDIGLLSFACWRNHHAATCRAEHPGCWVQGEHLQRRARRVCRGVCVIGGLAGGD
jgi:hypothetical protein